MLAALVITRHVVKETGLGQPVGDLPRDTALPSAETQELADRGQMRVHRLPRRQLLTVADRSLLKTELCRASSPKDTARQSVPLPLHQFRYWPDRGRWFRWVCGESPTSSQVHRKAEGFWWILLRPVLYGQGEARLCI